MPPLTRWARPTRVAWAHTNPNLVQVAYRGRSGDTVLLNDTTGGWAAPLNTGWTQATDATFRVRLECEENAGAAGIVTGVLEARLNAGVFQPVTTTSTIVKAVASGQYTDGAATFNLLAGSALAHVQGSGSTTGDAADVSLTSQSTEFEYALQIVGADVANGDTVQLRVSGLNSWTNTASITVSKAATVVTADATIATASTIAADANIIHIVDAGTATVGQSSASSADATVVTPGGGGITPVGTDGHTEATASGTAVTSALPTGLSLDGTEICFIEVSHGSGATNTTISTPAGWNLLTQPAPENSTRNPVFWRILQPGDTAPSFTLSASRFWATHSTAFGPVDTTSPINASQGTGYASASSYTSATITPTVDNCMIVACWGGKVPSGSTQTITVGTGWADTSGITQSAVAAQVNQWDDFQYLLQATAAAVSEAVTVGSSQNASGYIIALAPAAGGGPIIHTADATIAQSSAITAAGTVVKDATATIGQTSAVAVTATQIQVATATISQVSAVSATGTIPGAIDAGTATIGNASSVSAVATVVHIVDAGIATIAQTSSVVAIGTLIQFATATIANTSTVSAMGQLAGRVDADAAITQTSAITAAALQIQVATATVAQTSQVQASATKILVAIAATGQASVIAASAIVIRAATAALQNASQIAADARVVPPLPEVGTWDVAGGAVGIRGVGGRAAGGHDTASTQLGIREGGVGVVATHEGA